MNTEYPKITIITPSFNQALYLEETIHSVLSQNYPNLEYIIIDGNSKDGSIDIIRKYEKYLDFWVSEPDQGQSDAIIKGFQHCTGLLWNWLNSDDLLEADALENLAIAYKQNPKATLYSGRVTIFGDGVEPILAPPYFQNLQDFVCLWESWSTTQPGIFIARDAYLKTTGINPNLHYGMDYELYLRLAQLPNFFVQDLPCSMARARRHPTSKTVNQTQDFIQEILQIFDGFAIQNPSLLPSNWKKSRTLFGYINDLQNMELNLQRKLTLSEFLTLSRNHLPILKYRFFWGALRRKILPDLN